MVLTQTCPRCPESPLADTPTVFVVDADACVREALGRLIRSAGWQPTTASSAEEFLAHARVMAPCCLLAELHLPMLCGLDLQSLLLDRTELPIIFMCEHADIPTAVRAMRAGALEILTKPLCPDEVMCAMRHAIDRSHAALDEHLHMQTLKKRYASLSAREKEVMSLLAAGRLNKQVGFDLGISEITVKKHRGRVMRKMRAGSFAELVTMSSCLQRRASTLTAIMPAPRLPWPVTPSYTRIASPSLM